MASTVSEFVGTVVGDATALCASAQEKIGVVLGVIEAENGVNVLTMARSKAGDRSKAEAFIAAYKSLS
jgi:hypothetical protein